MTGAPASATLRLVDKLSGDGCERTLGLARAGDRWATASTGTLCLWRGLSLDAIVAVPGHVEGAPAFDDLGTVRVGRFVVAEGAETVYLKDEAGVLSASLDAAAAGFPERFAARRVEWVADGSAATVVATYHKPRQKEGTVPEPPSPPDRLLLVGGDWDRLIAVIDPELDQDSLPAIATAVAGNGGYVAVSGPRPRVIDSRSAETVASLPADRPWDAVAWAPGATHVALSGGGEVAVCAPDGTVLARWAAPAPGSLPDRLALSPGGTQVALASGSAVTLWSGDGTLVGHAETGADIDDVAFSCTGQLYVASGSPARAIGIYDAAGA